MLNQFIINIMDIVSALDGNEIKIYNKENVSKFGIKTDAIIVSGESKTYIPEISKTFGITSVKLLKQIISNKEVQTEGTFELVKEHNQFTNEEEISILKVYTKRLNAQIRLAGEDILQKIPIAKDIQYNINCKDIDTKILSAFSKDIELLENNDEYLDIDINDQDLIFNSGKKSHNMISITCPFLCNNLNYVNQNKYRCKDIITAIKIITKFNKADININNQGLFTFTCENDYIKIHLHIRGSSNVQQSV